MDWFKFRKKFDQVEPAAKVQRLHEEYAAMRVDLPALAARWSP